jgi:hypothetical protein
MYKLLLIEDSKEDSDVFLDTIKRMNSEYGAEQYEMITASSYTEGLLKISKDLNGVIVDIKLDNGNSGNEIIREIMQKYRLPVAIFTGTPDTEQDKGSPIIVYRKGEAKQEDIVTNLCRVSDTGLFKVLGGTGIIESAMTQVFWSNLYPQINLWKSKKESGVDTEKVLLRYVISHIQELIDSEMPAHVTEEMYICPPINMGIKTGSIIQKKSDGVYFIVLSPPCDLSVYNGKVKTDYVLLCEIVEQNTVNTEIVRETTSVNKQTNLIAKALNNNYTEYYHWLPENSLFSGGYINFRKVITYSPSEILEQFNHPLLKVQEGFVKSILGRFSAYYARQGQPDFDFETEAANIVSKLT